MSTTPSYEFHIPALDTKLNEEFDKLRSEYNAYRMKVRNDCLAVITGCYDILSAWRTLPITKLNFLAPYRNLGIEPEVNRTLEITAFMMVTATYQYTLVPRGILISSLDGTNPLAYTWAQACANNITLTSVSGELITPDKLESFYARLEVLNNNLNATKALLKTL